MKKVTTYLFAAFCALAAAGLVPSAAQAAVVLDLSPGGLLLGARNVDVGGTLYDVTFLNGSCVALFNGCNEASDFTFHDFATAVSAAQALLDQVLLDGPLGNFDSNPLLTNGCDHPVVCAKFIPFDQDGGMLTAGYFDNFAAPDADSVMSSAFPIGWVDVPYALFTPVASVPEPASALLLGSGLIGWIGLRRRRGRASAPAVAA